MENENTFAEFVDSVAFSIFDYAYDVNIDSPPEEYVVDTDADV